MRGYTLSWSQVSRPIFVQGAYAIIPQYTCEKGLAMHQTVFYRALSSRVCMATWICFSLKNWSLAHCLMVVLNFGYKYLNFLVMPMWIDMVVYRIAKFASQYTSMINSSSSHNLNNINH